MESHNPGSTPPPPGPTGSGIAALTILVLGHIAAFAAWYDDIGELAAVFGLAAAVWAAFLFGYPGALIGSAGVTLINVVMTDLLKPEGQSLASALFTMTNTMGHPVMLATALMMGRQRRLADDLQTTQYAFHHARQQLREAQRQQTESRINARLHRADRMASVGTLAAGVAHEINNPLTYVIGNLYYALERLHEDDPATQKALRQELIDLLRDATDGSERVRRIVRDLKTFSRSTDDSEENRIDAARAIQSSLNLVRNEIRHRASLEVEVEDNLPLVAGNESRLVQVLVNLLMNASQAIPEGNAEAEFIRVRASHASNGRVTIEVSDTGSGMPPEVRARVFDPFFTTKPVGEGTGLGLSVTHGIVASMDGDIGVASTPGEGSTFTVSLPTQTLKRRTKSITPPPLVSPSEHDYADGPLKRALVVDDEPKVAASVARLLDGFEVLTDTDGRDALDRLRRDRDFDVVLCDLMMPHLTGMELFERIRAIDPGLAPRFVFMTGGAFTPKARAFISDIDNVCIEKPFDAVQLDRVLSSLAPPPQAVPSLPPHSTLP